MTKRLLIAAALLGTVALGFAATAQHNKTARWPARAAEINPAPPQDFDGGPVIDVSHTPGIRVVSREVVGSNSDHLRIKVENLTSKRMVAWSVCSAWDDGAAFVMTFTPGGGEDIENQLVTEVSRAPGRLRVAVAYEDGEVKGPPLAARELRRGLDKLARENLGKESSLKWKVSRPLP